MTLFLDGSCDATQDKGACLEIMKEHMPQEEIVSLAVREPVEWDRVCRCLEDAEAIVLAADVYMDSVPSCVLSFLERIEQAVIAGESIGARFYAILYTKLYEGEQTSIAMGILKNFCIHANIAWGRGLGIGGDGIKAGPRRKHADYRSGPLREQALFIREKMEGTDAYINPQKVSRNSYMRRINHEGKKSSRIKIAQS